MAKQTFTTGQVLTAAQMTSLQQTAMGGGSTIAKTTSYVLTAADAGTVVQMNSASATTITVNTALFAAGDTVQIQNIGAGVCTVTAGTATVNTAGSLALSQYENGTLYFTATGASLFFDVVQPNKILQVLANTAGTTVNNATTTYADTGLSLAITPSSANSKILVMATVQGAYKSTGSGDNAVQFQILRDATSIMTSANNLFTRTALENMNSWGANWLDSPATTSSTTYKVQFRNATAASTARVQDAGTSSLILMEVGA